MVRALNVFGEGEQACVETLNIPHRHPHLARLEPPLDVSPAASVRLSLSLLAFFPIWPRLPRSPCCSVLVSDPSKPLFVAATGFIMFSTLKDGKHRRRLLGVHVRHGDRNLVGERLPPGYFILVQHGQRACVSVSMAVG